MLRRSFRALVFIYCGVFSLSLFAQGNTVIGESQRTPDVRVIIDISGSMKQNDPLNLRRPALELLVQLFPEGSRAGVWTFGQWVNNLVPSDTVNQPWRDKASAQAVKINSVALRTNIPEALKKAVDDIDRLDPAYKVHLILLTDGVVDVSKSAADNDRARERIINDILPRLRDAGVTIHTVALSQNADQELMEQLAIETGGLAAIAETADDLTEIFLQAFDAAAPAEQVPLEGNNFLVDASIDEFTALVFSQPGGGTVSLVAPNGETYSRQSPNSAKWFHQQNYDLITIKQPFAGEWRIDADLEPNSRVTIVSDLSLQASPLSKSLFVGDQEAIQASLTEQGEVISRPEFLNLVDVSVEISRREDGERWLQSLSEINPIPDDGLFRGPLDHFDHEGIYDVTVMANGKTFQRQSKQTLAVREPFDIRVASTVADQPNHSVTLFARNSSVDEKTTKVVANIQKPDGSTVEEEVPSIASRRWRLEIEGGEQSGYYQVMFDISGLDSNGSSFSHATDTVSIEHQVAGSAMVVPEPELNLEPEPVAEPQEKAPIEPTPEPVEPEPEPEPVAEEVPPAEEPEASSGWQDIALYTGIGLGNLLVLVLGFFAYKAVSGSPHKSDILESSDEVEVDEGEIDDDLLDDDADVEETAIRDVAEDAKPKKAADPEPIPQPDPQLTEDNADEALDDGDDLLDVGEMDIDEDVIDIEDDSESIEEKDPEIDLDDADEDEDDEPSLELEDDIDDLDDMLDLPDDAIDIDPDSEKEDK